MFKRHSHHTITIMDSVKLCAGKLGYTIIERNISATIRSDIYTELEVITKLCASDKSKIYVFSNKRDVEAIQEWRKGFGNSEKLCHNIFIWDNIIYYIIFQSSLLCGRLETFAWENGRQCRASTIGVCTD